MSTTTDQLQTTVNPQQIGLAGHFGESASWRDTLANAMVITRREVRDSFRDWRIIVPIVILTLFFPMLANFASRLFINLFEDYGANGEELIEAFLPLMPMIVGFFPVSISLVIALETFVGEKERRSLEPLLSTPLTNTELYLGKVVAATIPPLVAGYVGIVIYLGGLILGSQQWRPEPILVIQILALTTVQAVVMVTGAVVISSQTTSTRAANLLASAIILPMSLLVVFESFVMIKPDLRYALWYIAAGLLIVVILLVRTGARIFRREELLGRSVDEVNIKWAWRIFWEQFKGVPAQQTALEAQSQTMRFNPIRWYRESVFESIKSLRNPSLAIFIAMIAAFIFGWYLSNRWVLPIGDNYDETVTVSYQVKDIAIWDVPSSKQTDDDVMENLRDIWEQAAKDPKWIQRAVSQNVRVLVVAGLLGLFTFGVLTVFVVALPFGILGYIIGNIVSANLNILPFIVAIVPHGIVEIPAIIIAGAAALRAGSVVTKPNPKMTVGEAWLRALSDGIKIGVAVVLPLLIIAAVLEVKVTPYVVNWALELGF